VGVEEESVVQNVVQLVNEAGLEDFNDDGVEEWLQSHSEILSNDELRELAQQHIQSESEVSDAEEETPVRDLTTEFLSNTITAITQIMDQFIDNDPDWERSNQAKRGVLDMTSCYRELLRERKLKKRQSTLDAYIKKKPRFAEDPQPGPSSKM